MPLSHYMESRRRYPDKAKTLPKIGRVLCFVDKKDAVLLSIDILNFFTSQLLVCANVSKDKSKWGDSIELLACLPQWNSCCFTNFFNLII